MSDRVFTSAGVPIPGMRIVYQQPIGPDGRGISFEVAEDATISKEDLNEMLDRVSGAARRLSAIEELPLIKGKLLTDRELLKDEERRLREAGARLESHVTLLSVNRRKEAMPPESDTRAIAQLDQAVSDRRSAIRNSELRIPYLQALIDGRTPPELFPELKLAEAAD